MSHEWVIGVDLGRTKVAIGLVSPGGQIVAQRRIPTSAELGAPSVVERIAEAVHALEGDLPGGARIAALGVCAPGPVDHAGGRILDVHEMGGLANTPFAAMLSERLGVPASLDHDAKSAAVGEFYYGGGRGERAIVYIVVGTGVGSAIVVDGQVFRGVSNMAGELGHITLNRDGELCPCGSRGCVETYASGPWVARRYLHRRERYGQPPSAEPPTGELVAALAQRGDPLAAQVLREAGEALGAAIASAAMILDIDRYIIGGSVAKAGDLLLGPARAALLGSCYRSIATRIQIAVSEMVDDGPILGCAHQARALLQ
jgi:glucokinase